MMASKPMADALWDRADAPVLVEKQPCNLPKAASLRAFLQESSTDYRFIVMRRHPCLLKPWLQRWLERDAADVHAVLTETPAERLLVLEYEQLATRPDLIAHKLLAFLPQLESLRLDMTRVLPWVSNANGTSRNSGRDLPMLEYQRSPHCHLSVQASHMNRTHLRWLGA